MILSFSTHINKKPTYFVEKIITGLVLNELVSNELACNLLIPRLFEIINKEGEKTFFTTKFEYTVEHLPKIHTIRLDPNNRGTSISRKRRL